MISREIAKLSVKMGSGRGYRNGSTGNYHIKFLAQNFNKLEIQTEPITSDSV